MIGVNPLSVFEEAIILPDQTRPRAPTCPELRLLLACLQRAIDDLGYGRLHTAAATRIATEARNWIALHDDDYAFSFSRVCQSLALDEQATRHALLSAAHHVSLGRPRRHYPRIGAAHHPGKRRR